MWRRGHAGCGWLIVIVLGDLGKQCFLMDKCLVASKKTLSRRSFVLFGNLFHSLRLRCWRGFCFFVCLVSACCRPVISFFPLCEVRCARVPKSVFSPWESGNKWQLFSLSRCFKDPCLAPRVTTVKEDQMTFSLLNTDVTKLESIHFDFMCPSLSKTNKTLCSAR